LLKYKHIPRRNCFRRTIVSVTQQNSHNAEKHEKNDLPHKKGKASGLAQRQKFLQAKKDLDIITDKLGITKKKPSVKKSQPAAIKAQPNIKKSQPRQKPNAARPNAKPVKKKAQPTQAVKQAKPQKRQEVSQGITGISASDLAEKALDLDDNLQFHADMMHDLQTAKRHVSHALEKAQAASALSENLKSEKDYILRSFLIDSINGSLKNVSDFLNMRKARRLNFLTGEGFKKDMVEGLEPLCFSTHINLLGEGMSPQVILQNVKWLNSSSASMSDLKPIAQFSTSAIESTQTLSISHGLTVKSDAKKGVIYSPYMMPKQLKTLFCHFDTSQAEGLKLTPNMTLTDLSGHDNDANLNYAILKGDKIALSACPINQQRGISGTKDTGFSIHLEPSAKQKWKNFEALSLHFGISTSKPTQARQTLISFGTQEAGLHIYTEKTSMFALTWSNKGKQRIVVKAPLKANSYQVISLIFNSKAQNQTILTINNANGEVIHQTGRIKQLKFDEEGSIKLLQNKLPILNEKKTISLIEFADKDRFKGVFTEGFISTDPLSNQNNTLLKNYLTLKWASVCLSLSVVDQRSQLESIGSARICLCPSQTNKSVVASKRADSPEIIALIVDKLNNAAKHLIQQEKKLAPNPECTKFLSDFSGEVHFESEGFETPEQIAELLASSIKINLSHKKLSLLEQRQIAALSIVQNKQTAKQKWMHTNNKNEDFLDLTQRNLLPSMDEICDDVGF